MKGISYVLDDKGERTGVLIDLRTNGELWEDFHDAAVARGRAREPRVPLEEVRKRLKNNARSRA